MIGRLLCAVLALLLATPAVAQNSLFAPAIRVNSDAITHYEIEQRARFLAVLNTPGDLQRLAREQLIDEKLQLQQARRFNVMAGEDELRTGIEEFAGRADLSAEQFIAALEERGISRQTFEDFIRARSSWRNVVQGLFGARSRPTDEEVQRAMAIAGERGRAEVLVSEIILPMTPDQAEGNRMLIERLAQTIDSEAEFADAARSYSIGSSARQGGHLDWLPISNLPPSVASMMLTLEPGDITEPVPLDNALAIFRLRGFRETGAAQARTASASYLRILLPGGDTEENRRQARQLEARLDRCDDFHAITDNYPDEQVDRQTLPRAEIPDDLFAYLERLDPNQILVEPVATAGGPALMFLMLCGRTTEAAAVEGGSDQLRLQLFSNRIDSYARNHLEELRANAVIEEL